VDHSAHDGARLVLLGGFELRHGQERLCLPLGAQRLLGFLALRESGALRTLAAEALWPHRRGGRAAANLRSALWQTRSIGEINLIDALDGRVRLASTARVDVREVLDWAHEITGAPSPDRCLTEHDRTIAALARELLPDWADDWLLFERERWDQVRLHALEVLARRLIVAEQYLPALEAALTAVAIEPVRESGNRAVMEVHIAEGNMACAIKHYQRYRSLLQRELGVTPSRQMDQLIRPLISS
jgi:DNA-binding SARP family transcriptional activator